MKLKFSMTLKYFKFIAKLIILTGILLSLLGEAFATQSEDGRPTYDPRANEFSGSVSPFVHAAPKSLPAQRLSSSSYPVEAELFCGTDQCLFGLTRGLVIGGRLAGMLSAPMRKYFDSNAVSGTLSIMDAFGGFQILRDVDSKNYMTAQIGYRRLSFDDGTNQIITQGFTTEVHYSQLITPIYLQGLDFCGYLTLGNASLNNASFLNINSVDHTKLNNTASYFYRVSQAYPTYRIALPADLELINWSATQTGFEMPIHGYLHLAPFYIQNNLAFAANNISLQKTEQNFGMRVAGVASYESSADNKKYSRYAMKSGLGIDFSTSNFKSTSAGNAELDLPKRPFIAPYIELAGRWMF